MHMKKIQLYQVLIILCLSGILLLMGISMYHSEDKHTAKTVPVRIIGSYRVDGQKPLKLTEETEIDNSKLHTIVISGHFSTQIPKDKVLMLLLDNIRVLIRVNGREVYRSGQEESTPSYTRTAGNTWGFYISPGITGNDDIEITLKNVYKGTVTNVFDEFLSGMSYGYGFELYQLLMEEKMPSIILGFSVIVIGVIVLVICSVAGILKAPGMGHGMALAVITMIGGCWIFINGGYPYITLLFTSPLLFNTIDELQIYIISVALVIFTYTCLHNETTRKTAKIISEILLVLLTGAILVQIAGWYDLYDMQGWAVATGFLAVLISALLLCYEAFTLKHRQTLFILLSWLPLLVSASLEVLNFYFRFMPKRAAIQYGFALSLLMQFYLLIRMIRGNIIRMQRASHLEYELLQSRMAVMLSQIQPHFLINTLNDIRFLYRESPTQAEDVLVSFTRYLRGNMDSLNQVELVPFEQELKHLEYYVSIEKTRFGTRLNVVYEINCTDFTLPVLTIQPLVENAIRHGVAPKREGGTVSIRSFLEADYYVIEVRDDGLGFDPLIKNEDGMSHNGIENVRLRLQSMCGGKLTIKSSIGAGTVSLVHIPKENEYENTCN